MYDIAKTIEYQYGLLTEKEYKDMMRVQIKQLILADLRIKTNNPNYFNVNMPTNNLNDQYPMLEVAELSQAELLNNPALIIKAVAENGVSAVNYIKDLDFLKQWCHSNQNYFPEPIMTRVAMVLGDDFSYEKCKNKKDIILT